MHILVYCIPTFIDMYRNIKQFSCQGIMNVMYITSELINTQTYFWMYLGVEKNNDVAKGYFSRSMCVLSWK